MKTIHFLQSTFVLMLLVICNTSLFAQFPSILDLRTCGLMTSVKDQGSTCGSCWAFATCAAIESQWLQQGYGTEDLSEDNIIDCHGFDESPCAGGSFYMSQAMLSVHKGILSETNDPYSPATQNCPYNLTFPPAPVAYVEDMLFIPSVRNDIKQALTDYGAVATTMFFNSANYNAAKYKYYDAFIDSNDSLYAHCVTIAGWNDTMTFPGAPANGGWIIKDSYGTGWAQNGYFYCSYYDAGILGENAVFPVRYELRPAQNKPHVYAHDQLGWIDNYGTGSNQAWGLVKYTLLPSGGMVAPQQVKRIGTYAVADNTTIDISVWRQKNGNVLSGFVGNTSLFCQFKGFYTIPFYIKSDTVLSEYFIKVRYQCPSGIQKPVPVEKSEQGHSTGLSLSTGSCWVSSDGVNWNATGTGTSSLFDLCIKMYTENAPIAAMGSLPDSVCAGTSLILNDMSMMPKDSSKWYINQVFLSNAPSVPHIFQNPGNTDVMLVVWLGLNTDTVRKTFVVVDNPATPVISQNGNSLVSTAAYAYQWLDQMMNPISGASNQTFFPQSEGTYYVVVYNSFGCQMFSSPFQFTFTMMEEQEVVQFKLFPNPATGMVTMQLSVHCKGTLTMNKYDFTGRKITQRIISGQTDTTIMFDASHLSRGSYLISVENEWGVRYNSWLIRE